jgi:hypothetical protein
VFAEQSVFILWFVNTDGDGDAVFCADRTAVDVHFLWDCGRDWKEGSMVSFILWECPWCLFGEGGGVF